MTVAEMSDDQIQERLAEARAAVAEHRTAEAVEEAAEAAARYRYLQLPAEAAEGMIEVYQNQQGRFMLGLREIDMMTRGHGRGELTYITGFAHSGKTQVFLGAVLHNLDVPVVLFTFDEPAELVFTKLICMKTRSNAERLEERIKAHDPDALERVRRIARDDFANVMVIDQALGLGQMTDAMKEAEDYYQREIAAVGIDFLELLRSDETEVGGKSQELKRWTKDVDVPVICLHQGSRGNAGKGQKITMQSMKYGGEAEAIMVLGVRQKADDESLDEWERLAEKNTISVSIVKNKRPPSKKGEHDFYMDPECGLILPLHERPETGL